VLIGLVNGDGELIRQIQFPTLPEQGTDSILMRILEALLLLQKAAKDDGGRVRGIGIACTGVINSKTNSIVYSRNLGWRNMAIGEFIFKELGLPVRLGNDANLAAVAEYVWGTQERVEDLIYITVSTGVGAGIICGGQLVTGVSESALQLLYLNNSFPDNHNFHTNIVAHQYS